MPRSHALFFASACLLSLLLAAGCGSKEPVSVDVDSVKKTLTEHTWYCQQIFSREVHGESPLTLKFMADGTVTGSGGCNEFKSTYTLAAEGIGFGPFTSTEESCGAATDEQEYTYLSYLARIHKYKLEGDELEFYTESEAKPMLFTNSEDGGFFPW
jgi:putative lipoprotein